MSPRETNVKYHDDFHWQLLSFVIDQLQLLFISEQVYQYSIAVNIIRISFLWQNS